MATGIRVQRSAKMAGLAHLNTEMTHLAVGTLPTFWGSITTSVEVLVMPAWRNWSRTKVAIAWSPGVPATCGTDVMCSRLARAVAVEGVWKSVASCGVRVGSP